MHSDRKFRRLFRFDKSSADVARAVDEELQFHFDLAVRDLMVRGATAIDARAEAERRFGDVERTRQRLNAIDHAQVVASRRTEWLGNVAQDLRYAIRGLLRRSGFAIAVVVILALGIGANATMFGIVDRLLLRTPALLARADHVQLVYLARTIEGKEFFGTSSSYQRFRELTDSAKSIDAAVAFWNPTVAVGMDNAREFRVQYASAALWKFFDMRPALGRFYSADEDVPQHSTAVTVLSYDYWQTAYGGQKDIIGKQLRIGRLDYTIIGVAAKEFGGLTNQLPVAFIPLSSGADNSFPGNGRTHWYVGHNLNWMQIAVRRKPNSSLAATTVELDAAYQNSYAAQYSGSSGSPASATAKPHVVIAPIQIDRGPNQRADVKVSVWLVGVALIVLIIACANVSNLLLARAFKRRREIALRLALGISRGRLLAQLLIESVVLAMLGGFAGLAVTEWGGRILRATLLPNMSLASTLSDGRTLLFTLCVALGAGVLIGLVPALREGGTSLAASLKAGSRESTYQRSRLRSALLIVQGALSVVLLIGAGLFVRSLNSVRDMRLGYDVDQIAWVQPEMRGVKLGSARTHALYDEIIRVASELPITQHAAFAAMVPFYSEWNADIYVPGIDSVSNLGSFLTQVVSPDYFETMGTRIVRGHGFTDADRAGATGSIVVSESMARKLWPGKNALSQCVKLNADTTPCRFVTGVAEDIKYTKLLDDPALQYYVPREQFKFENGVVYVRVRGYAASSLETLRSAIQKVMPGGSYVTVKPLTEPLDQVRRTWQLGATMFALFGALALLVASVGLYSVISYTVAQRTQEMAVRVALGAQTADVIRLVLRQSVTVSLVAVSIGLAVSLLAAKWVEPLLFKTSARDPVVYGTVATTLIVVAILAALFPALRASRVDPNVALRSD